jgi:hypothetical protein
MDWKLKQGSQETAIDGVATLKRWTTEGRIQRDDYVFNPVLGKWLYAKDTVEIQELFSAKDKGKEAGRLNGLGLTFGIGGLLLGLVPGLEFVGGLLLLIGIVLTIVYYIKRP